MIAVDTIGVALIERVVAGEPGAWSEFAETAFPVILERVRKNPDMRKRSLDSEDHARDVMLRAVERLRRDDFVNLRQFLARQESEGGFRAWLYTLVNFAVRDYLREVYGSAPSSPGEPSAAAPQFGAHGLAKRDLHTLAKRLASDFDLSALTPGATAQQTATEVMQYVLREFTEQESMALLLYVLDGQDFAAIATELGLEDGKAAERLIRKLKERLRVKFARDQV